MDSRSGSITPNSMMVLERGAGGVSTLVGPAAASRPPSGRRSRARTPVQRSGSQLEVLPPTEDDKVTVSFKTSSRPSSRSDSTEDGGRQTHSAESTRGQRSRKGRTGETPHEGGLSRAESLDSGISPREGSSSSRPGSAAHKQVSLTTVKRNYEMHGAPRNESYDFVPKEILDMASTSLTNGTIPSTRLASISTGAHGGASNKVAGVAGAGEKGGNGDGVNIVSEKEMTEQRLNYLMEQLSTKNEEIRRHEERRGSRDAANDKDSEDGKKVPSAALKDPYYVSTGSLPTTQAGASDEAEKAPPFLEDKGEEEDEDSDDDEDDDEEEEGPKAPIELMSEFLDAVMEEEFETADKLCKMILIYEPENPECLQFKPLIEEMLKREWHDQLWGSGSEGESGDDDDDDENEDNDDEDDDDDDDSDEDSSDSDSSEESDDEEDEEEEGGKKDNSPSALPTGTRNVRAAVSKETLLRCDTSEMMN